MFGFSSTIGNLPMLRQIAGNHGIRLELVHCEPNYLSQSSMHMEIFEACYADGSGNRASRCSASPEHRAE